MSLRYLFGPVAAGSRPLPRATADNRCAFFSRQDLQRAGSWEGLCAQLPGGWRPDLVVLELAYKTVPAWLWEVPAVQILRQVWIQLFYASETGEPGGFRVAEDLPPAPQLISSPSDPDARWSKKRDTSWVG